MAKILKRQPLNPSITLLEVDAPRIARKALPGQFVILRLDEYGERIPFTIADTDPVQGSVTIIFQKVGLTTRLMDELRVGDCIQDFVGPLGEPTPLPEGIKRACVVGGGVGCAIVYPQAKHLFGLGVETDVIAGFRSKDMVMLEDELRAVSSHLYLTTDDGSYGIKGFVTHQLQSLIDAPDYAQHPIDLVIAIGPVIMMKIVSEVTRPYHIPTLVSLNPIMMDGTGMCGVCRVSVGGKTRFACVEGPDFDGHEVDFDELMSRNRLYQPEEAQQMERHACRREQLAKQMIP